MQNRFFTLTLLIFMSAGILVGCNLPMTADYLLHASEHDRIRTLLKAPRIGDIYVARVDHFSAYVYGDDDAAFALLQVSKISPNDISVYSSNVANTNSNTVQQWLKNTPKGFTWDKDEEIIIPRHELLSLFEKGMLIEAIRPPLS